jgi:hypothetical protein
LIDWRTASMNESPLPFDFGIAGERGAGRARVTAGLAVRFFGEDAAGVAAADLAVSLVAPAAAGVDAPEGGVELVSAEAGEGAGTGAAVGGGAAGA